MANISKYQPFLQSIHNVDVINDHNNNISKVDQLLNPLSKFLVTNIIYTELVLKENKALFISNKQGLIENFLQLGRFSQDFYNTTEHYNNSNYYNVFVWPQNCSNPIVSALNKMDLFGGFTIIHKTTTLIKTWAFANYNNNNKLINLFVNNHNIFYHFIQYFDSQLKNFNVSKNNFIPFQIVKMDDNILKEKQDNFLKEINWLKKHTIIRRHYFNNDIYITNKEWLCLLQLAAGKTHKEIAKKLAISPNTVRHHLDAIKVKTNIHNKSTLIDAFLHKFCNCSICCIGPP